MTLGKARLLRLVCWAAAAWIAWELLYYEQYKLTGNEGSIDGVFQPLATWLGMPAHEKPLRIGVAILVLIPPVRVLGAGMAFGLMSGASFFHAVGPIGIDPYGDGGKLFKEACFTWAMAALILWIQRDEVRALPRRGLFRPPAAQASL